jgi:hypothetical protein
MQVCAPDCSGYGACVGSEVCNGCDDNGDGRIDETFACARGSSRACTTMCGTSGTQTCDASCSGYSTCAASEVCNRCDDDADGRVDEGLSCGPTNDECSGAAPITLGAGRTVVTGTTSGATHSADGCSFGSATDVWYQFTLSRREVVFIHTYGSSFDTVLGMKDGSCGAAINSCTDDSCGILQTQLVRVLDPGTYFIQVDGFGSASGSFTLTIEHLPVGNDGVARTLSAGSSTPSGTTSGTGVVDGGCGLSLNAPEHMYYWTTCPSAAGGTFSANTCDATTNYDTVLYVLSGNTGGALVCNDDDGSCSLSPVRSRISTTIPSGAGLYALYVDGFSTAAGTYAVTVSRP